MELFHLPLVCAIHLFQSKQQKTTVNNFSLIIVGALFSSEDILLERNNI